MPNKTIKFRRKIIESIFPAKLTKMREEDFISRAVENKAILNEREFNALVNVKEDLHNRRYIGAHEFFAKRKKNKIELIPFDKD